MFSPLSWHDLLKLTIFVGVLIWHARPLMLTDFSTVRLQPYDILDSWLHLKARLLELPKTVAIKTRQNNVRLQLWIFLGCSPLYKIQINIVLIWQFRTKLFTILTKLAWAASCKNFSAWSSLALSKNSKQCSKNVGFRFPCGFEIHYKKAWTLSSIYFKSLALFRRLTLWNCCL